MRLFLLRHGEVESHRGDVPITSDAEVQAFEVGRVFASEQNGPIRVLSGETRRARDTASHLARGVAGAGGTVVGPDVAFALRNPDLYLNGVRVDMVSSRGALAAQIDGLTAADVDALSFFPEFIDSGDRIGWWLTHESPPGETATDVAARVRSFAISLTDPIAGHPETVVAVTHSPLLRAAGMDFLGRDIGEPPWISGLVITAGHNGTLNVGMFSVDTA